MTGNVKTDVQSMEPGSIIDLYQVDLTAINNGTTYILYFHPGVNGLENDVVWQGNTYIRYPIEASGFERRGNGTIPRPTIRIANITGTLSALIKTYQDLLGAKVTRKRTFVKYLDAVNFPGGVNPQADPNVEFPDEVWLIDRKSQENGLFIEFELAASFDITGVKLPRRQCIQNTCTWKYRSAECSYAGGPVATINDVATSDPTQDACGKRLDSCKLRFGNYSPLPFGGFPGVGLIR